MFKENCLAWITCILFSQQVLCGTGQSVPIDKDNEERSVRTRQSTYHIDDDDHFPKINFEEFSLASNSNSYESCTPSESSEEGPTVSMTEGNQDYPVIDLEYYSSREERTLSPQSYKLDLHPKYTKNPILTLENEIFRLQRAFHVSKIPDNKVFIITGTGKQRPGANFRLKNTVVEELKTKGFFSRRISKYYIYPDEGPNEGLVKVFLRKDIKPQSSEKGEAVYVIGRGWGRYEMDLTDIDFSEGVRLSLPNIHVNIHAHLSHQLSQVNNMIFQLNELDKLRDEMIQQVGLINQRSKDPNISSEKAGGEEVYIITGKQNKLPRFNVTLKTAVLRVLQAKTFQLISAYDDTPQEGILIFLNKYIG